MKRPPYGRRESFNHVLDLLGKRKAPVIVEIGMTREKGNWMGDGYSTPLFAWFTAVHGGVFHSVDIDGRTVATCRSIIEEHGIPLDNVHLVHGDGIAFVREFKGTIDLLYLDGWDYSWDKGPGPDAMRKVSEEAHLECYEAARDKLVPGSMILIDDMFDAEGSKGKGRLLCRRLAEQGLRMDPRSREPLAARGSEKVYQFLFYAR